MKAEKIIIEYALKNGADDVGICSAEPFEQMRKAFEENSEALKGFAEGDVEKRINPSLSLENAKSIIAIAKSYNMTFREPEDNELRGKISAGAVGEDYHNVLKRILQAVADEMKKEFEFNYKIFVDTGALSDRAVAVRSGMGSVGKNGCVVAENGGAAVFLGYMITDMELESPKESSDVCTGCGKCVRSCPTGALGEERFEIRKCISYITQLKRELTKEEMISVGNSLYGCEMCQLSCPLNKEGKVWEGEEKYRFPSLKNILSFSNRQFKEIYGETAIFWRGNSVIKRNAIICAANSGKEEAKTLIEPFLKSENPLLRDTAEKALEILEEKRGKNKWDTGIREGCEAAPLRSL